MRLSFPLLACAAWLLAAALAPAAEPIDFNRDIRPILSNKCFTCHGPDESSREAGLRFDERASAVAELESGLRAIVPGDPEESELIYRIRSTDKHDRMPPAETGKPLSEAEIALLTEWVKQDAPYAKHWSYERPVKPPVPFVQPELAAQWKSWPKKAVDFVILQRLAAEGLTPSPEADRHALVRRVTLDLTGLPPTPEEVERFVNDPAGDSYEKLVDRLLASPAFGEHWARKWLDLARYADSAGYADDPPREIWAYRDWVIRAINNNLPLDELTRQQLAGDLLPNPSDDQLVATAFHRNTLTNNEGGTNDEEYRNVAIVDRVNTTFDVWMGTTMACAQCHTHKYDPITQEEYFRLFAIFNNTQDADRRDESPLLAITTAEQEQQRTGWEQELAQLETKLKTPTAALRESQAKWEAELRVDAEWRMLHPAAVTSAENAPAQVLEDRSVLLPEARETDTLTLELPLTAGLKQLAGLQLETLPHDSLPGRGAGHGGGNFVLTKLSAVLVPPGSSRLTGRYVRVTMPGEGKLLSLAEVQVFGGEKNLAQGATASQSSTAYEGPAKLAVDGNTNGDYFGAKSTTHTGTEKDPWWEVDLGSPQPLDRIVVWNRTDGNLHTRLTNFRLSVLDDSRDTVWEQLIAEPPNPSAEYRLSGERAVTFVSATADYSQDGFPAAGALGGEKSTGWAVGGAAEKPHRLTLLTAKPLEAAEGSVLRIALETRSPHKNHTLGHFRLAATEDPRAARAAQVPAAILQLIQTPPETRSDAQAAQLSEYFLVNVAEELAADRKRLEALKKQLAELKPATTVPVMREMAEGKGRTTKIQIRGNFLQTGEEVQPGMPAAFHVPPEGKIDRLALAEWIVSPENPLTPRVVVNREWEAIFGRGLVVTSEDFGSQGEPPSHPQLLDWLAMEFVEMGWDRKAFLRLLVTSATYRQSSALSPALAARDPENVLLARGPRVRHTAEMVRDQALAVSGLLSGKMYGPPVRPPQPNMGLSAAFGGGIDWKTSEGEDRYRRGLYTTWRRSNPYPSMATFDAPNREVCTVRRTRSNTPLQALVTLNDPVYVEAAQALGRLMQAAGPEVEAGIRSGFLRALSRPPSDAELATLTKLHAEARAQLAEVPEEARKLASDPLGPLPKEVDPVDAAAWTVVGNVLLNLDEMFMKR